MKNLLNGKTLFIDFDSTFVKIETIDELAKITLKNDDEKESKLHNIFDITQKAMSGELDFPTALQQRMDILSLTKDNIKEVTQEVSLMVSDSFVDSKELIRSISNDIWILSGGFKEVICPIVSDFGINESQVIANSFIYDGDVVTGCDTKSILFKDQGKTEAIKSINLKNQVAMIGDGYTDLEVFLNGAANVFICYTENIKRDDVANQSEYIANNFNSIIEILGRV